MFFNINKNIIFEDLIITTLGPTGTSSEYVAKKILKYFKAKNKKIILKPSFEEAFENVKNNKAHMSLVANAYSKIDNFYMDKELKILATFIHNTPPYGLATSKNVFNKQHLKIITHKAPLKILKDKIKTNKFIINKKISVYFAPSTSIAAQLVAENKFNLKLISDTYTIHMVWSLFGKQESLKFFI